MPKRGMLKQNYLITNSNIFKNSLFFSFTLKERVLMKQILKITWKILLDTSSKFTCNKYFTTVENTKTIKPLDIMLCF